MREHLLHLENQGTAKIIQSPCDPCMKYHFCLTDGKADAQTNEGASKAVWEDAVRLGTAIEHLP